MCTCTALPVEGFDCVQELGGSEDSSICVYGLNSKKEGRLGLVSGRVCVHALRVEGQATGRRVATGLEDT